jgi:pimeloyl-ACP methyl ester carboxylesterase
MIALRRLFLTMVVGCVACFADFPEIGGLAAAQTATQSLPTAAHVQVDLFRGLADIFSGGMNTLTDKLNRSGYSARVYSTNGWQSAAKQIADRYSRGQKDIVVLIGHSLGADATFDTANELDRRNIPVELIVTFDGTKPSLVPKNVLHLVNFYQNNGIGKRISAGPGFQGELTNIDLSADPNIRHINIDKSARLHAYVVTKISEIVQKDLAKRVQASKPKAKKKR